MDHNPHHGEDRGDSNPVTAPLPNQGGTSATRGSVNIFPSDERSVSEGTEDGSGPSRSSSVCPECGLGFSGFPGVQHHRRMAHAEVFHSEAIARVETSRNRRWTEEEEKIMARFEAQHGDVKGLNLIIQSKLFPHRSTNQISCHRKGVQYRELVAAMKESTTTSGSPVEWPVAAPVSAPPTRARLDRSNDVSWSSGESRRMAEFETSYSGRTINKSIFSSGIFPGRSLASISGHRRTMAYRNLVATLRDNVGKKQAGTPGGASSSESGYDLTQPIMTTPILTKPCSVLINRNDVRNYLRMVEEQKSHGNDSTEDDTTELGPILACPDGDHDDDPSDDPGGSDPDPDNDTSSEAEAEDPTDQVNQIKATLLMDINLTPVVFHLPQAQQNLNNIHPRILARRRYAAVQKRWTRDRGRVVRDLLCGRDPLSATTFPDGTKEFWTELFSRPSPVVQQTYNYGDIDILYPITLQEVQWVKKTITLGSAPGPDGLTSADFKNMPDLQVQTAYCAKLQWGITTEMWQEARTALIPKSDNPRAPSEFRPITITSNLTRGLHKILAKRLGSLIELDVMQRGFRNEDGVAGNLVILKRLLRTARSTPSSLYIAFLDFKKAFDSVYHGAILESAARAGLNERSIKYLASIYNCLTTEVFGEKVRVRRGVAQGDPLSPTLFNLTLQQALRAIPDDIGVAMDGNNINWIAFADDVAVVATSRSGLQLAINTFLDTAAQLGLSPGVEKCATMGILAANGTWYSDGTPLTYRDTELPRLGPGEFYKYLGVQMGISGPDRGRNLTTHLQGLLARIKGAPLKPQQKLWGLKVCLLPKLLHTTIFCNPSAGTLKTMDKKVRKYTRKMLHLPGDTPMGAFHSSTKEGGLGLISFATSVPALTKKRLTRLAAAPDPIVSFAAREEDLPITVPPRHWANKLHVSCDGAGLREAHLSPASSKWVDCGTRLMRGASYIMALKTRLGVLTTPARSARGREAVGRCDLGCLEPGTLHHLLQVCPRVQPWRIARHNSLAKLFVEKLRDLNFSVLEEPRIPTRMGLRIPDMIFWKDEQSYVVDAQVCSDSNTVELQGAHMMKVEKYDNEDIVNYAMRESGTIVRPVVSSLTVNWRGIVAPATCQLLRDLKISKSFINLLAVRTLRGSVAIYANYMGTSGGGDVT